MAWAPDYITATQLKAFLSIGDTVDDVPIAVAITAASRAIDLSANRQFGLVATAEERFYTGRYDLERRRWIVEFDDLMTVTGLDPQIQDGDGVDLGAIDDYVLEPRNAAAKGRPWTHLVVRPGSTFKPTGALDEVAVTARWGWTSVPVTVEQSTYLQSSRFFARRVSPFGVAGSPDLGSEIRLLNRVDADVSVALADYRRWWGAA